MLSPSELSLSSLSDSSELSSELSLLPEESSAELSETKLSEEDDETELLFVSEAESVPPPQAVSKVAERAVARIQIISFLIFISELTPFLFCDYGSIIAQ